MSLLLPKRKHLKRTSNIDYFQWNYQFPIKYIQRFRFRAILNLLGSNIYNKILEVGMGSGIFLPELARHCQTLYACDNHNHIDAVDKLCKSYSIKAQLKRCSNQNSDYPEKFFDVIVAVSVLEFVEDLEEALNEIKRILKPQGMFLTICPQKSTLLDFILGLYTRKKPEKEFIQSRNRLSKQLEVRFNVEEKKIYPPLLGRLFPVYYYYKLTKGMEGAEVGMTSE